MAYSIQYIHLQGPPSYSHRAIDIKTRRARFQRNTQEDTEKKNTRTMLKLNEGGRKNVKAPSRTFFLAASIILSFSVLHIFVENPSLSTFDLNVKNRNEQDVSNIANGKNEIDVEKRLETAVIILTSLILSHPSLWMLERTIGSLKNLNGLHPKTPIYITVDSPKSYSLENAERLDLYTQALYRRFSGEHNRHVTIVANHVNRHISGTIRKVVFDLIDANVTKYIYVLQHDLMFVPGKVIEHTALVDAFDKYYDNNTVRLVGFGQYPNMKYVRKGICKSRTKLGMENPLKIFDSSIDNTTSTSEAIYLTHTKKWSDNNHFTTVEYYRTLLNRIGPTPRPPEAPMSHASIADCLLWGTHFYGGPNDGRYICHLDGRNVTRGRYHECPDEYRDDRN